MRSDPTSKGVRTIRSALAALLGVLAVFPVRSAVAKPRVPDKATSRARVSQLYSAKQAENEQAMLALILPQIVSCGLISPDDSPEGSDEKEPLRIISWRIKSIRFDLHNFDTIDELCPGQPVRATAGALVIIKQTDQEPGEEPSTGELDQPWLYVNDTWYWLIDVD